MHDPRTEAAMQIVFDGAEEAQGALHNLAGIECALNNALEPVFARLRDPAQEQVVWALVRSIACFRAMTEAQVRRMQNASMGRGD